MFFACPECDSTIDIRDDTESMSPLHCLSCGVRLRFVSQEVDLVVTVAKPRRHATYDLTDRS